MPWEFAVEKLRLWRAWINGAALESFELRVTFGQVSHEKDVYLPRRLQYFRFTILSDPRQIAIRTEVRGDMMMNVRLLASQSNSLPKALHK